MKRFLIKLSGEALSDENKVYSPDRVAIFADFLCRMNQTYGGVVVVVGGGNLLRGRDQTICPDRVKADQVGMLATVMNAMTLGVNVESQGASVLVMSAVQNQFVRSYDVFEARSFLDRSGIVFVAGGTANPFVSTDFSSVIRSLELNVDEMLKGTSVYGVYDKDPKKFDDAKKYDIISGTDYLAQRLEVVECSAVELAVCNYLPINVFNVLSKESRDRILSGEKEGSLIS